MPTYVWTCTKCPATEIVDRRITEYDKGPEAPACGHKSEDYTRQITHPPQIKRGKRWGRKGNLK